MRRSQDHLLREPRREDRAGYIFLIFVGCFLLLVSLFDEGPPVNHVLLLAGLSLVAQGAAESLPPRWRTVAVVLRVACLLLWVAAGSILLVGLIPL